MVRRRKRSRGIIVSPLADGDKPETTSAAAVSQNGTGSTLGDAVQRRIDFAEESAQDELASSLSRFRLAPQLEAEILETLSERPCRAPPF